MKPGEVQEAYDENQKLRAPKRLCRGLLTKFGVVPGESWGNLSKLQIQLWMKKRCDRFFCQRNEMEGRGSYRCIPLAENDLPPTDLSMK